MTRQKRSSRKRSRSHTRTRVSRSQASRDKTSRAEALLKDVLGRMTEASYEVARKLGFRGSFMTFLKDLQEALEQVQARDRSQTREKSLASESERVTVH